ncbi:MAG TPA: murein L,D-transpeptidase [Chloroflexi bacterium]|nr:murein L,D-transpeptidase [Chloroflexota bacterium]
MRSRLLLACTLASMGLGLLAGPASAGVDASPSPPQSEAVAFCPLDLQLRHPFLCRRSGARTALFDSARRGEYPERPFPLKTLDPTLGNMPFHYLRSRRDEGTPLYTSVDDAFREENPYRTVPPGFVYFSWIERYERHDKVVYMIVPGVYIRGEGLARVGAPTFRGLAFSRTPSGTFAWILNRTESRSEPGYDAPATGRFFDRFQVVWVYETRNVGGWDWYRIGPQDWIEQRLIAKVEPDPERPEGVESDRWISINLYEQTLAVYEGGEMIYATLVSSGLKGWWTRPGVFQVFEKLESTSMEGAFEADRSDYYYLEDVPWSLYFDEARALHGAYWHNGYGYPRSHGCVNLSPADAHWIYNWADIGTYVYVFDPSGETPTDPSAYGTGGV